MGAMKRAAALVSDGVNFRSIAYRGDATALVAYAWSDSEAWVTLRAGACAAFVMSGFGDAPWRTDRHVGGGLLTRAHEWVDLACVAFFLADACLRAAFTIGLPWGLQASLDPTGPGLWRALRGNGGARTAVPAATAHTRARGRWDRALAAATAHPFHDSPRSAKVHALACGLTALDVATRGLTGRQWSGLLRPACLFYYSEAARIAGTNSLNTLPSVASVVLLEWYVVLVFAAAAVLLFGPLGAGDPDSPAFAFRSLGWSALSLFQLSAGSVNDPDVWLPIYALRPLLAAAFFVVFLIIILYGVHNLVIATVSAREAVAWRTKRARFTPPG